ncbi:MAG: hypothetical protein WC450_06550 [Candidatus Omnitrophota bacterium]|jgi:hypothetical protein
MMAPEKWFWVDGQQPLGYKKGCCFFLEGLKELYGKVIANTGFFR